MLGLYRYRDGNIDIMDVAYEDNYSVCQGRCLICSTQTQLRYSNYNYFHMVCAGCAMKLAKSPNTDDPFGNRSTCSSCGSLVKVVFNLETDDAYSPSKYADSSPPIPQEANYSAYPKNRKQDFQSKVTPDEEVKSPTLLNPNLNSAKKQRPDDKKTLVLNGKGKFVAHTGGPVVASRSKLEKRFKCDHDYCETCSVKLENCMICKKDLVKVDCSICNRGVALKKRGDFWECSYCNLLSLECVPCKTFGSALDKKEKCSTCNCPKSSNEFCRVHQLCERCFKIMGNECGICSKGSFKCKSCDTLDIMCFDSLCPYCYFKAKRHYCLSCKKT